MRKKKLATYAVALAFAAAAMTGVTTRTAHAEEAVQVAATETDAAGIQETEATVESQTAEETTEAADVEADEVAVAEGGDSYYNLTTDGGTWNGNQYVLNGQTMINTFFCDGTYTYYLQADGTPMKDRLTYHPDGEHVIYFNADGHEVFSDFANVNKSIAGYPVDDMCFFDVYGYMYVNQLTFDKSGEKIYFVNEDGVIEKGKWTYVNGAKYFDQDKPAFGKVYAQEDGSLLRNTFTYWNGNLVYVQGEGFVASGLWQIEGMYYLLDAYDGHIIQASTTHPDTYTLINGEYIETYNKNDDLLTRDHYDSYGVLRFHYEASYNAAGKMIGQKSVRTDEQGGTHTEEEVYNDMGDIIKMVDIMDHYLWLGTYNWTYSDIMEYSYTYYPSGNKSYCKTKTYWNDKLTGEGETYYNDDAENSVSDSNWVDYD